MVQEIWESEAPEIQSVSKQWASKLKFSAVVEKAHQTSLPMQQEAMDSIVLTKCDEMKKTLTTVSTAGEALECGDCTGSSDSDLGNSDQNTIVEVARSCVGSEDDALCLLNKLGTLVYAHKSLSSVCSSLRQVERGLKTSLGIFCQEEVGEGTSNGSCSGRAVVQLVPANGSGVGAILTFVPGLDTVRIVGKITGLSAGKHGFSVYEFGSTGNNCLDAGGHFNPDHTEHSGPGSDWEHCHAGDLGNIITDINGDAYVDIVDMVITLGNGGSRDVNTRTIVVHADEDDLGLGTGDLEAESKLTGNAGERLSCGVIQTFKTSD